MNFEQRCVIPSSQAELWDFLMDLPVTASCVPGVEEVALMDDGRYSGRLRVKVGPISLAIQGVLTIQEMDKESWRASISAEGSDRRVGGGVHATAKMTLVPCNEKETELFIQTEARFLGKLGEFGQPLIRKKAEEMIIQFGRNVSARLAPTSRHQAELA